MSQRPIHYCVFPVDPAAHLYQVTLTLEETDPRGQRFSLPAWIPGSYMIRDFARHVVRFVAWSGSRRLDVEKLDKHTWRCEPCSGPLRVEIEVYAWDLSVRGAHLDSSHGYFNGACLFLRAHGYEKHPCTLEIRPPEGAAYDGWRVATAMPRDDAPLHGFGRYRAADYEELIDHPVETGTFTLATFEVPGVAHDIVITGRHRADMQRLCRDLKIICEHHVALFGELPAMERYVFQVMAVGDGYGGLEHRASTSLLCSRDDLPYTGMQQVDEGYRRFLGLCSHEYFHTWNVKRIRPVAFDGCELDREIHTRQLWAYEGITSYYDDLSLVRSGLIDVSSYLELLGQTITRVLRGSGRHLQSVAESSFDAWTRFYKQDENAANAIVSYYAKGALLALGLDMRIRRATNDTRSLDDVMRRLWVEHGKTGIGTGESRIEELASEVAGIDLSDFFARHLYGTEDVPLQELLQQVGVSLYLRPAEGLDDAGGKPAANRDTLMPWVGLRLQANAADAKIAVVYRGSPAMHAGLSAGDEIIAIDGIRADKARLATLFRGRSAGEKVHVHAFRRDELFETVLELGEPPADTAWLEVTDDTLVKAWLLTNR